MNKASEDHKEWSFISGGGEMGELTRTFDWSQTVLGPPKLWPQSLKLTLSMILSSKFPMFLWWGDDLIQFYNDAYRPSLGNEGKHPKALGQKAEECWPEIWDTIYPLIHKVRTTAEATWSEDQLLPIYRNGKLEDVYWTFGYSPIFSSDMNVEGVLVVCTETTSKIKARQALEESEERFRLLAENADLLIATSNEHGRIDYFNKAWEDFTGRSVEKLITEGWRDLLHPDDKERFLTSYSKAFENREMLEIELRLLNKNNEYRWILAKIPPLFSNDGVFKGFLSTCLDITEMKNAQQNLVKSEQRLASIVENAPFPIGVYVGREMRIVLANKSIMDVWSRGYDIVGKTYFEVLPELENQQVYQKLLKVYDSGEPFHAKNQKIFLNVNCELKEHYFNYSFTPLFDAAGKVYGVMNTAADITDINFANLKIKQNEKHLQDTILQAPVAICIMKGPNYIVELANNKMLELWGVKREDILGKPVFDGIPEAENQGLEGLLNKVLSTGETVSAEGVPVKLPRKGEAETVYVDFVYQANHSADGVVSNIMAIATDVTPQVKMRQKIEDVVSKRTRELAEANSSLQKSNAELAQFAHIASHDLQEPLRKIAIFTQMLESGLGDKVDEVSANYLSKIRVSSNRMHNMIKDVLTYSELLNQVRAFKRVELTEIIKNTILDYELLIEEKAARVEYDTLPAINAIPLQMEQLFGNLIGNALKFSKNGTPLVIQVKAKELNFDDKYVNGLDTSCNYIKLSFVDNGIGFEAEFQEQIFNIFQRLHSKADYSGTGIGLAMCKRIVQNHLGIINAEGSSGNGATFNVILPYIK
ncbi:hypothetical protein GCM10011506_17270 [Marivirga lumbricoides]|uniref:histidine kinase n=1 Tax=Marivirga lumbricoides TaxID=1046115 RepID=A0ABQ1M6H4_9BACT|nr:hypothetical protein GCM10011506_17270 [Marivirga lumbricoides]